MKDDVTSITGGKGREECPFCMAMIPSGNGQGKVRLLMRDDLDGRTRARRQFDRIALGICQDLGGEDRLTTIQRQLVQAFAGCCIQMHSLNTHLLLGEQIDAMAHSSAISNMVRVASRLGIHRVAREVMPVPTIAEYLEHKQSSQEAAP